MFRMDKKKLQDILRKPGCMARDLREQFKYARMKPLGKSEAFVTAALASDTGVMQKIFTATHNHAHQQVMVATAIHDIVDKGSLSALWNLLSFEKSERAAGQAFDRAIDRERADIVAHMLEAKNGFDISPAKVASALERLVSCETAGYAEKTAGGRAAIVKLLAGHGGDIAKALDAADQDVARAAESATKRAERLKAFRDRL